MKTIIKGRVTSNIEITNTPGNKQVANLRIAENKAYIDENGEKQLITNWFTVAAWDEVAEDFQQSIGKGDLVELKVSVKPDHYYDEKKETVVNKLVYTAQDFRLVRRAGFTHEGYQAHLSGAEAGTAQAAV